MQTTYLELSIEYCSENITRWQYVNFRCNAINLDNNVFTNCASPVRRHLLICVFISLLSQKNRKVLEQNVEKLLTYTVLANALWVYMHFDWELWMVAGSLASFQRSHVPLSWGYACENTGIQHKDKLRIKTRYFTHKRPHH